MKNKFIIQNKKVFYAGLVFFLMMLGFIGLRIMFGFGVFGNLSEFGSDYLFAFLSQIVIMLGFPLILYKVFTKQSFKQVFSQNSFRKVSGRTVLYSIALGVLTYILIIFVASFWNAILSVFGYAGGGVIVTNTADYNWGNFLLNILFVAILPGFCEEFAHRGMLLGSMKGNGIKRAILLSALLFGLMHLNVTQFGYAFVVGLLLGALTVMCKSIWPAMIVHFMNNALNTYATFASVNGWFGGNWASGMDGLTASANPFLMFFINFLVLIVVVTLMSLIIVRLFTESKRKEFTKFKQNFRKQIQGTEMEKDINFNDNEEMFDIYQRTLVLNLQNKLERGEVDPVQLTRHLTTHSALDIMLNDEMEAPKKPVFIDNLFFYISIFLTAAVTFVTFLWGVF